MNGSPAGALSSLDWKSIGWTLATAAVAAVLTVLIDSVLPDLENKGKIDAGIAALLVTVLHGLRKWLTDTRVKTIALMLAVGFCLSCATASAADPVTIDVSHLPDGEYPATLTVKGGQVVDARPLRSIKFGGPTSPPTAPPPVNPSAFSLEVQKQAQAALDSGATKTTGAAISSVYSLVSDGVADGSISTDKVWEALKQATDLVVNTQPDKDKWTKFRADLSTAVTALRNEGKLGTKEQIAAALKDVSVGLNLATGFKGNPRALASIDPRTAGILDGIDIAKLIELIKIVLELLKAFK